MNEIQRSNDGMSLDKGPLKVLKNGPYNTEIEGLRIHYTLLPEIDFRLALSAVKCFIKA